MVSFHAYAGLLLLLAAEFAHAIILADGPDDTSVLTGEAVILRCRVDDIFNEHIVWYHRETDYYISMGRALGSIDDDKNWRYTVLGDEDENIYDLLITNADFASDDGTYICGYSRQPGDFVSLGSAILSVLEPSNDDSPQCFVDYYVDRIPMAGDFVYLVCQTIGGNPAPNITWYRDEKIIESAQVGVRRDDLRWALREDDLGVVFVCKASNDAISKVKSCDVIPYPDVPDVNIRQIGRSAVGSDVKFVCETNARGSLRYRWTNIRRDILLENRFQITDNNRVLQILNLQRDDLNTIIECEIEYESFPLHQKGNFTLALRSGGGTTGTRKGESTDSSLQSSAVGAIIAVIVIAILIAIAAYLFTRRRPRQSGDDKGTPEPVKFKKIGETTTEEQALNGQQQTEVEIEQQKDDDDDIKTDLRLVDESKAEIHEEK